MKSFWNVLRGILATCLSIVLVLVLIAAPITLSALSLWSPQTVTNVIRDVVIRSLQTQEQEDAAGAPSLTKLSARSASAFSAKDTIGDVLESILGQQVDAQTVEQLLNTDAAKELIGVVTEDVTNALLGNGEAPQLTEEKLKQIVADNMDEIMKVAKQVRPDLTEEDLGKLEADITRAVEENAPGIIAEIPDFSVLREELVKSVPGADLAMGILAKMDVIKWVIVILAAVLSLLIFLCRLPGLRGFRWLAVDMFIGGGISAALCMVVTLGSSAITKAFTDATVLSASSSLLSAFTQGALIRTGVILVIGGVMLTAHILTKKLRAE